MCLYDIIMAYQCNICVSTLYKLFTDDALVSSIKEHTITWTISNIIRASYILDRRIPETGRLSMFTIVMYIHFVTPLHIVMLYSKTSNDVIQLAEQITPRARRSYGESTLCPKDSCASFMNGAWWLRSAEERMFVRLLPCHCPCVHRLLLAVLAAHLVCPRHALLRRGLNGPQRWWWSASGKFGEYSRRGLSGAAHYSPG